MTMSKSTTAKTGDYLVRIHQKAHHTVRFFQMKFRKNIDLAIVICVAMFVHRT